jgi:hypothetical protein
MVVPFRWGLHSHQARTARSPEARQLEAALGALLALLPMREVKDLAVVEQRDIKVHRLFGMATLEHQEWLQGRQWSPPSMAGSSWNDRKR